MMEKAHFLCSKCGMLHYRTSSSQASSSHWPHSQATAIGERSPGVSTPLKVRSNFMGDILGRIRLKFIDNMVTNPTNESFLPDKISLFKRVIIIENKISKHAIGLQPQ
jgi:hypothetical protein